MSMIAQCPSEGVSPTNVGWIGGSNSSGMVIFSTSTRNWTGMLLNAVDDVGIKSST